MQNGIEAMEIIDKKGYKMDVLVTDVIMSDMNGKELSKKVSGLIPDTRVTFMSGYADDNIVFGAELQRDVNFIQKAFSVNTLLVKIREVLEIIPFLPVLPPAGLQQVDQLISQHQF